MKYGLTDEVISKLQKVFAQHPEVNKVLLYGSRAKGNFKHGSDIDLTIVDTTNNCWLNTKTLHTIEDEIDDLLLPYKIDLSLISQISKPELLEHIQRVGVVFYLAQS